METQNTTQTNPWPIILRYGFIYALVLITTNLILYITGNQIKLSILNNVVMYITIAVTIYLGIKTRRDTQLNGFITYGQGLGTGVLISLAAGFILTVYFYVFATFIDPDMMENAMNEVKRKMIEDGESEETIERVVSISQKMKSPVVMALGGFASNFFLGFIGSLIISAFTKKADPDGPYKSLEN